MALDFESPTSESVGHVLVNGVDLEPLASIPTLASHRLRAVRFATEASISASSGCPATLKLYLGWSVLDESMTLSSIGFQHRPGFFFNANEVSAAVDWAALLLTCSADFTVRSWDGGTGKCLRNLPVPNSTVMCAAGFSKHRDLAFTSYLDRSSSLWDLSIGRCLWTSRGHSGNVRVVSFSPDQVTLITGSEDGTAKLWDVDTGYCKITLSGHGGTVRAANFGPDGSVVLTGSLDATAKMWDVADGECLRTFSDHNGCVLAAAISPNGSLAATGCEDCMVRIWDPLTSLCVKTLIGHDGPVCQAIFYWDSSMLVTASTSPKVMLWNVNSGELLRIFGDKLGGTPVQSISFSPIGTTIFIGGSDGTAKLWNVETGACLRTLEGHTGRVLATAYSSC